MRFFLQFDPVDVVNKGWTRSSIQLFDLTTPLLQRRMNSLRLVCVLAASSLTLASSTLRAQSPSLSNLSTRAQIGTGTNILIAGLTIGPGGPKTVLLRAAGPTLGGAPFNVPGVLADPRLEVFSGSNKIAENDNWSTAIGGATPVTPTTFSSVGASDADNDPLTYNWAFSDGTTATGTSVTKTFSSAGTFTATLTVRDGRASATATGGVTIRTLSGTWTGGLTGIKTVMTLNHSGGSISGSFTFDIGFAGTVSGSINPTTRVVTLTVSVPSFQAFTFTGNPSADFNTLSGVANGSGFVNDTWNMTR